MFQYHVMNTVQVSQKGVVLYREDSPSLWDPADTSFVYPYVHML